jgi:hypothetical protein
MSKKHQQPTSRKPTNTSKRPPEKKIGPFNAGIGTCIWLNTIETDAGPRRVRSITINPRRYLDRESNEWRDAASFNPADLPALIFALQKAQEYCYETPVPGQSDDEQQARTSAPSSQDDLRF